MADPSTHSTNGGAPTTPTRSQQRAKPQLQPTPHRRKLNSDPNPKKLLTHVRMDPALKDELHESQLRDVPRLVEHLFPDSVLPLAVDELAKQLTNKGNLCQNPKRKTWVGFPDLSVPSQGGKVEAELAIFLNVIGTAIHKICKKNSKAKVPSKPRRWDSSTSTKPLAGGPSAARKPDLNLIEEGETPSWTTVKVTAELTSNIHIKHQEHNENQLTNGAYMVFSSQDERRFHIGVSFCQAEVRVYVFDRAGVVGSVQFDLEKEPKMLIRLLAGLTLSDPSAIGFDPTIRHEPGGNRFVTVAGKEYEIIETLFISDTIRGRGTVCWRASFDGADYVIKNTWADVSRDLTEPEIMKMAGDLEGIAHIVAEEIVQVNGRDDKTDYIRQVIDAENYRDKNWYAKLEIRAHRRIVSTPLAEALPYFSTKKELISVLIDAIEAHRRLVEEKKILHRDISMNNIMMYRPTLPKETEPNPTDEGDSDASSIQPQIADAGESHQMRRGMLIDLDYALLMREDGLGRDTATVGHRTGTLPFMAIELLTGLEDGEEQKPRHDLESFFYVLLWICWHYAGPNNAERQNFDIMQTHIKTWIAADTFEEVGDIKGLAMTSAAGAFDKAILRLFAPYFEDLKPCVEKLRKKMFPELNTDIEYQDVIDILEETRKVLPDTEDWTPDHDKEGYGLTGSKKRKLESYEPPLAPIEEEEEEVPADHLAKRVKSAPDPERPRPSPSKKTATTASASIHRMITRRK
ncbi:hypothetical protein BDZ97DRAFT_1762234 [Flammula alnicola]|nr:hypothetical protein BDZ97DRAFT_1762234 [Flammula alnicola]